jgi:cytosine/adenosine deaminase-related metal-dependent hydrolase
LSGLVNAHTHVYSGLAPLGMPPPAPPPRGFLEILERVWWRLDRALDAESLRAASRLYVAEALLAGTTVLVDHHESPSFIEGSLDVIADACQDLGMRAVLCFGATERNLGRDEARRGLGECRLFIRDNTRALVRGVVGLHASFTVSDETIREAGDLCRELGTVLHVHMAEDRADVDDARARGYDGPLERLVALGALPRGSVLAHGVHLEPAQVELALDSGAWLVQNPRSNRHNRVGYPRALWRSDRVALGTDGFVSDMPEEARVLLDEAQEHGDDVAAAGRRLVTGFSLAAQFFPEVRFPDRPAPAGTFGPGPASSVLDRAVALREACRRRLVVDGRVVLDDGRLCTGDIDGIREEAKQQAARLWTRL